MSKQTTIISSANAKFFAEICEGMLMLYREKNLLWKRSLPSPDCSVIGLGNNGILAVRSPGGILLYSTVGEERNTPIEQYSTAALAATSSFIRVGFMEERGNYLALERVTERTSISERIFKQRVKDNKDVPKTGVNLHELLLVDLSSLSEERLWYHIAPKSIPVSFIWKMNADLSYYAVCEFSQRTIPNSQTLQKVFLVERNNNRTLYSINFVDAGLCDIRINYQGSIVVQIEDAKERQLILIDKTGRRAFITPPDAGYEVLHLGKHFVVLKIKNQSRLILKTFDDKLMYNLNLSVFDSLERQYIFIFRPNDDIILAGHENDESMLKITYTTVDNFDIECKRWQLIAEEHAREQDVTFRKQTEEDRVRLIKEQMTRQKMMELEETAKLFEKKPCAVVSSRLLASSVAPEQVKEQNVNKSYILNQLERLKLKFITGDISKEEYEQQRELLERELACIETGGAYGSPLTVLPEEQAQTKPPVTQERAAIALPVSSSVPENKPALSVPEPVKSSEDIEKVEQLLEKLEERFIMGEISEKVYVELKEKYEAKLKLLKGKC